MQWGKSIGGGLAVYAICMLLGTGISSYATYESCQKTNTATHFTQGAIWGLYPFLAWILMRIDFFRAYFERFYMSIDAGGIDRAGWISAGYGMMLAGVAGMFMLIDWSVEAVCIPSVSEATAFREAMMKLQQAKARAQESTPAVTEVH